MALARLTILILTFFWMSLFSLHARGATPKVGDPEKKITISIFDLVKKHAAAPAEHKSELNREYVELVVAALKKKRTDLLSCLKNGETLSAKILIVIASEGGAQVSSTDKNDTLSDCAVKALSEVDYPAHHLKGNVEIELPLRIEKRTF